jgi:C4-dicarboxylate-specific signal transduction histidine kinase
MTAPESNSAGMTAKAPAGLRWNDARKRMAQLENSAGKLSSTWFLGMTGLIAAAVMFVACALALSFCLARLSDHFGKVQHTENVLSLVFNLQESLDEAVSEARGFMALKDERLLQVREEVLKTIRRQIGVLKTALRDDPEAERMVRAIEPNVWLRRRMMDEAIALSRLPHSIERLRGGETARIRVVRQLNGQMEGVRDHEHKLIADQQRLVHWDIRLAIALLLLTGIVAPVCGLLGIRLLRLERDSRRARELQLELMHVQRLAIMGQTAAMLAHELNQPLAAATNFLAAARRNLENAPDKVPVMIERIGQQIQRADGIVRKLRRFIEKRETERSLETPDVLIEDAITLLGTIDSTIGLKTEFASDLPHVLVDRVQLQQVLVNLMRNAIEAMHDSQRRELTLSVMTLDEHTVEISLADTGPGLPPEVAERLFQPFVSTKPNGMGVGLSICQTIIAQHQGRIWAGPNPGGGTVFHFTLPVAQARVAA